MTRQWITPFKKQCFVSAGVILNIAGFGLVLGYTASLLPQLRQTGSTIPIDESSGSWIAAITGVAILPGNFISPIIMSKYGRRIANLISIAPMIICWLVIATAQNITMILIARFLQGFLLGICQTFGSLLIGEFTSPRNRAAFLTTMSLTLGLGFLVIHTLGIYFSWQVTALICAVISFVNLVIVLYSPESPSWLIDQERYEESRRVFRWLRGEDEEEELQKMIHANITLKKSRAESNLEQTFTLNMKAKFKYFRETVKKKEFYKPILIMIHLRLLTSWSGVNVIGSYFIDIIENVIGSEANVALVIITADIQRLITQFFSVYFIRNVKRRTVLITAVAMNITVLLTTAGYSFAKAHKLIPFDIPFLGIILIHLHIFSLAIGLLPMSIIISGEIYPLEYRSIASAISLITSSPNMVIIFKTLPFLFRTIGLHGAYCLYAAVVGYGLAVTCMLLPETKDKTLQDIEDEFRKKLPLSDGASKPLTSSEGV